MTLILASKILRLVAALLAWPVAMRRASYRPVAIFLGAMVALDTVRGLLLAHFDLLAPGPYVGARRVAFHASDALFMSWPAGVAIVAAAVFLRWRGRRLALVAAPWIALEAVLVASYPAITGPALIQWTHGAATLAAGLAGGAAVLVWLSRSIRPEVTHVAAVCLLTFTTCTLAGPYLGGVIEHWNLAAGVYAVLYLLLALIEGGFSAWFSSSSPSSQVPRQQLH